ncbi:hypothetical protein JXI42_00760 [bacterium]|nr:hypothetical protein [bacterium]
MEIIREKIAIEKLRKIAQEIFGDFVKAVIDVEKRVMSIGGELHSDEEAQLLDQGSNQYDLWGINLYPEIDGDDWIEFDSLINIRPSVGNRSRGVNDPKIRGKIAEIVNTLVER